jgi:hypothetical protein
MRTNQDISFWWNTQTVIRRDWATPETSLAFHLKEICCNFGKSIQYHSKSRDQLLSEIQ